MNSSSLFPQLHPHTPPQLTTDQSLFTVEDLDSAKDWLFQKRKDYSPNSDIWTLCHHWKTIRLELLNQLNDGSYQFSSLDRYEMEEGHIISLWSSHDMIVLKLLTQVLGKKLSCEIQTSCYHVKDHGGLKLAVNHTIDAAVSSNYAYVFRSDIKSYYESIRFEALMDILNTYINDQTLLKLLYKAFHRIETRGGLFYEYNTHGLPMGSPLSPLLGAIALLPLDLAMRNMPHIFYARFMDDWVVLTYSKTALRKVIKKTHEILRHLQLTLHPLKTYIGKISHGFNFLGYYMDDQTLLPSRETIRRFHGRASVLYEHPSLTPSQRHRKLSSVRDHSEYPVHESAPDDSMFKEVIVSILRKAMTSTAVEKRLRRYIGQWTRWLRLGIETESSLIASVTSHLPSLAGLGTDFDVTHLRTLALR
jgi:RNA-directed DNA polymerase